MALRGIYKKTGIVDNPVIAFARYRPVTPACPVTSETVQLPLQYSTTNILYSVTPLLFSLHWQVVSWVSSDGGGWLHGIVALHGRVHQLGAAKVVVPVEDVDDEVAQGKHNSGTIISDI